MKNGLLMIVLAATLLGGCATNRPATGSRYDGPHGNGPYGNNPNGGRPYDRRYDNRNGNNGRYENDRMEDRIAQYANELNLSRRQVRDIQQIQDRYDRRGPAGGNNPDSYRRLEEQKRREMLAVLTPAQQSRLQDIVQRDRGDGRRGDGRRGDGQRRN